MRTAITLCASAALGLALVALGVSGLLGTYGWGVFVALPFSVGVSGAVLDGYGMERRLRDSLSAAMLANVALGVALLVWKYEGMICLLMAAPLAIPLGLLGGWAGHALTSLGQSKDRTPLTLTLVFVLTPGVMTVE